VRLPWRRRPPLHERLRAAGELDAAERAPFDPGPHWGEVGIHGVHRQRVWDAVVTTAAPALAGDDASFVALEDGRLLLEHGDGDVRPLAEALAPALRPPYRAEAVRRGDAAWAVAGRRIRVVEVPEEIAGDHVTVTMRDGERTVELDGERVFGGMGALERLAGDDAVVTARRLGETLWEVEVTPL
jgi:hypothetical protein